MMMIKHARLTKQLMIETRDMLDNGHGEVKGDKASRRVSPFFICFLLLFRVAGNGSSLRCHQGSGGRSVGRRDGSIGSTTNRIGAWTSHRSGRALDFGFSTVSADLRKQNFTSGGKVVQILCFLFCNLKIDTQIFVIVHTIRKVKFLSKNSILTKLQHFTSFSPQIFLTIFLVKSKLSTVKKSKTTTFSRVFLPKKSTIFSGNQS